MIVVISQKSLMNLEINIAVGSTPFGGLKHHLFVQQHEYGQTRLQYQSKHEFTI